MKVGVFGGSFDPIHNGHLFIAEYIRVEFGLDKVLFIPVGKPSHRENTLLQNSFRLEMVKIAIEGNNFFEVLDIEMVAGKTNYTIDTLRELKKIYTECDFFEIIGEDSADYLETWKDYNELINMVKFYVFKRRGFNYKSKDKNIEVVDTPYIEISASEIRKRISENKSIKYFVPEKVEKYIIEKCLYRGGKGIEI